MCCISAPSVWYLGVAGHTSGFKRCKQHSHHAGIAFTCRMLSFWLKDGWKRAVVTSGRLLYLLHDLSDLVWISGERIPSGGQAHGGVWCPDWHHSTEEADHWQQDQGGEGELNYCFLTSVNSCKAWKFHTETLLPWNSFKKKKGFLCHFERVSPQNLDESR